MQKNNGDSALIYATCAPAEDNIYQVEGKITKNHNLRGDINLSAVVFGAFESIDSNIVKKTGYSTILLSR